MSVDQLTTASPAQTSTPAQAGAQDRAVSTGGAPSGAHRNWAPAFAGVEVGRGLDLRLIRAANLLALLLPAALLAGAWGFQLIGRLTPCEMCHWQRWPHYAALVPAALAFATTGRTRVALVALAALLIAGSGVVGVLHAGVEYHWWRGFTACTAPTVITGTTAADRLASLMAQPLVRCDAPAWTLGGVSMAGFNALFSLGGAAVIGLMLARRTR